MVFNHPNNLRIKPTVYQNQDPNGWIKDKRVLMRTQFSQVAHVPRARVLGFDPQHPGRSGPLAPLDVASPPNIQ